jgi:hypothetical protein
MGEIEILALSTPFNLTEQRYFLNVAFKYHSDQATFSLFKMKIDEIHGAVWD